MHFEEQIGFSLSDLPITFEEKVYKSYFKKYCKVNILGGVSFTIQAWRIFWVREGRKRERERERDKDGCWDEDWA